MPKLETLPEMVLTTADIEGGVRYNGNYCPVAICLRRHYPTAWDIFVSLYVWVDYHDSSNKFEVSKPLLIWMNGFDSGKLTDTMPFKLHLNDEGQIDIKEDANVS